MAPGERRTVGRGATTSGASGPPVLPGSRVDFKRENGLQKQGERVAGWFKKRGSGQWTLSILRMTHPNDLTEIFGCI
jgi:hypothetical protein